MMELDSEHGQAVPDQEEIEVTGEEKKTTSWCWQIYLQAVLNGQTDWTGMS